MKSLEPEQAQPDATAIYATPEHRKALKLLGSLSPRSGHTCFELDLTNGDIKEAVFEPVLEVDESGKTIKKLIIKTNCVYKFFLNMTNAKKQFNKMLSAKI